MEFFWDAITQSPSILFYLIGICIAVIFVIKRIIRIIFRISNNTSNDFCLKQGKAGERLIKKTLQHLPKHEYIILHNLLLRTSHGTSQLDHVVLSIHGIFVLETKNYSGIIYGVPTQRELLQSINGQTPRKIYNPAYQNYGHACALQEVLGLEDKSNIIPITVFGKGCLLSLSEFTDRLCGYTDLINIIESHYERPLTQEQINRYAKILKSQNIKKRAMMKLHIQNVNMIHTSI